jgi:hypothetical protein
MKGVCRRFLVTLAPLTYDTYECTINQMHSGWDQLQVPLPTPTTPTVSGKAQVPLGQFVGRVDRKSVVQNIFLKATCSFQIIIGIFLNIRWVSQRNMFCI